MGSTDPQTGKIRVPSVRDEVYELLRDRILNAHFPEGYRFDLNELSEQLGVSRTPLKEAIQRLQADGLLIVKPRSGTFVASLDRTETLEGFQVRRFLERGAAELLVERVTDDDIRELSAILDAMEDLLRQPDYQSILPRFISLDGAFHARLIAATRHQLLEEQYNKINTLLHVSRIRSRFERGASVRTAREHRAILRALKRRQKEGLVAAIDAHIDGAVDRVVVALDS